MSNSIAIHDLILHLPGIVPVTQWLHLFESRQASQVYVDLRGRPLVGFFDFALEARSGIFQVRHSLVEPVVFGPIQSTDGEANLRFNANLFRTTDQDFENYWKLVIRSRAAAQRAMEAQRANR